MKDNINLPPFYVGQRVVALVDGFLKKGQVYTVKGCHKQCCHWLVDVGLTSPVTIDLYCCPGKPPLRLVEGGLLCPESVCFAPIESTFSAITLSEVIEIETPLICNN